MDFEKRGGYVPPNAVARTASYRHSTGRDGVVGGGSREAGVMPEEPGEWTEGELMAGLGRTARRELDGPATGFATFLASKGEALPAPRGGDASWQDLYPKGTPGAGDELEDGYDSYEDEEAVKEAMRGTDVRIAELRQLIPSAVSQAERAEAAGKIETMAHFDAMAERLGRELEELMMIRGEMTARPEDRPSGLSFR